MISFLIWPRTHFATSKPHPRSSSSLYSCMSAFRSHFAMSRNCFTSAGSIFATKVSALGSIGSAHTSLTRSGSGGPKRCAGARNGSGTWMRSSSAEGRRSQHSRRAPLSLARCRPRRRSSGILCHEEAGQVCRAETPEESNEAIRKSTCRRDGQMPFLSCGNEGYR